MLVLDYVKKSTKGAIIIPPFHTGHLGLIPGTAVHASHSFASRSDQYELIITPFHRSIGQMVRVTCVMEDRPGVVAQLVEAIASLGINISTQVSSSIHQLHDHVVELIVDRSSVPESDEVTGATRRRLARWCDEVVLGDARLVTLFQSIVTRCGSFLRFDTATQRPMILLQPIHSSGSVKHEDVETVEARDKYHVGLKLSRPMSRRIRRHLHMPRGRVPYLLMSDTDERLLRVLFLKPSFAQRLTHVGFYHSDEIGALSAILSPLARAGFNIVTSLLRTEKKDENVWEAILDVGEAGPMSTGKSVEEICILVARVLATHAKATERQRLLEDGVSVGPPRYPKREGAGYRASVAEFFDESVAAASEQAGGAQMRGPIQRQLKVVKGLPPTDLRRRLVEDVDHLLREKRPSIFLSFPAPATRHAEELELALEAAGFRVRHAMGDEGQEILDTVIQKIKSCDSFVGIWHHSGTAHKPSGISPWMSFEYAVAASEGKKNLIVHSEHVDREIWKRINPGKNQPEYTDVTFMKETIPMIVDYCLRNLLES